MNCWHRDLLNSLTRISPTEYHAFRHASTLNTFLHLSPKELVLLIDPDTVFITEPNNEASDNEKVGKIAKIVKNRRENSLAKYQ